MQRCCQMCCLCPPAKLLPTLGARPRLLQEHPAVRKLLLPMLQADFQLIQTWRPEGAAGADGAFEQEGGEGAHVPDQQLPVAVAALGATQDARYIAC